jgi:hypothetical protein
MPGLGECSTGGLKTLGKAENDAAVAAVRSIVASLQWGYRGSRQFGGFGKAMSADSHRIRLRGPWNGQRIASAEGGLVTDEILVVPMPRSWSEAFGDATGTFRLSRRFGCPTGIGPKTIVRLEIETSAFGRASLNENVLGPLSPGVHRFDVTKRLNDGNHLDVELTRPVTTETDIPMLETAIVIEAVG